MIWIVSAVLAAPGVATVSAAGVIQVDGELSEPSWADATPVSGLKKYRPVAGGAPSGLTEVRFLQDERYLYIGIEVSGADYAMRARVSPRESINADDQVGIYLDTFHDGISGYIFYFNPLGIQQDIRHNAGNWNVSWDTLLKSRGHLTDTGFALEVAIPWRSLKFPKGGTAQDWGLIITRKIPQEGAKYSWPQLVRGTPRVFQNANILRGVRPPKRGSGLELVPSLTTGYDWPRDSPPTLFEIVRPSVDARFGITPDIGLSATLNPDFSQVESDISDVRLNARFAFKFPERRRFFLDGSSNFNDKAGSLYSRTMNEPWYGIKVGGREGPVTMGLLHVLDRTPLASVTEGNTPGFSEAEVEGKLASTTLLRVRTNTQGAGYLGVIAADKRLIGTNSSNQIGGVDFEIPMPDRWIADGNVLSSFTSDGVTELWGVEESVGIRRVSGVGTGGGLRFQHRSPGLRKEMGFIAQADRTVGSGWLDHTFTPQGIVSTVKTQVSARAAEEGNHDASRTGKLSQTMVLAGVHVIETSGQVDFFAERGAEVLGWSGRVRYSGVFGPLLNISTSINGGRGIDYERLLPALRSTSTATITLRPTPRLRSDTTFTLNTFQPEGDLMEVSQLIRSRLNWQFTRQFGARWVLDHSSGTGRDPRLFNSLLLTWLRNPGTAVWVGGTLISEANAGITDGGVFAKVTLLLRP